MTQPLFTLDEAPSEPIAGRHSRQKVNGIHYTPRDLAAFVARRSLAALDQRRLVVLDPACGDGELLLAVAEQAAALGLPEPTLVGIDTDADAIRVAEDRLRDAPAASVVLRSGDFLAMGMNETGDLPDLYDLVISNPPYVRTQVLGAARAQALGKQFGLTGRVDLYHAFVAGMTMKLSVGGVLGLLCSNRFLSTKGGQSLRSLLLRTYDIAELWDLGDTKLFQAAVLPAVVVGRRTAEPSATGGSFVRVYEGETAADAAVEEASLLSALEAGAEGPVEVGGCQFEVERGKLVDATAERPWRLTSVSGARWMTAVRKRSAGRLGDLGPIRVGIKTTADGVFISSGWRDLPAELRPEGDLVHPLLTHRVAARWRAEESEATARYVLYPHEMRDGRKHAIDLGRYPRAEAYLELHRERLEGREYVRKAGRAWYEIWVPQQPDGWAAPKLVWPDISDRPKFFLDESGAVVNGDCYWLSCKDLSDDDTALALAVANSSFALRYYDMCCGNRLYAGRRRFITQYLEELPLPAVSSDDRGHVTELVSRLRCQNLDPESRNEVEAALDSAVASLFGLSEEIAR